MENVEMIKVKAIKLGFHGSRRRPGDVFTVPAGKKGSWFVPVDQVESDVTVAEVSQGKPGRKAKSKSFEPQTFSEVAKVDGEAQFPDLKE